MPHLPDVDGVRFDIEESADLSWSYEKLRELSQIVDRQFHIHAFTVGHSQDAGVEQIVTAGVSVRHAVGDVLQLGACQRSVPVSRLR